MTILDFNQFKKQKENKLASKNQEISKLLNQIEDVLQSPEIPGFSDLDDVSNFIEDDLTDEFLDVEYELDFDKAALNKLYTLKEHLPNKMNYLLNLAEKSLVLSKKYQEGSNENLDKIFNLTLDLECKVYQFNCFLEAYDERFDQ